MQLALGDGEVGAEEPSGFVRRHKELVRLGDASGRYAPALKCLEEQAFQVLPAATSQRESERAREGGGA